MIILSKPLPSPKRGEPVWELARNFPPQGYWTEDNYLALDNEKNQMIEFTDGYEVLPMPTKEHQEILLFMVIALNAFAKPQKLGKAFVPPLPMKIRGGLWREPDVLFILNENMNDDEYPDHADLVVEIVSPDRRRRRVTIEKNVRFTRRPAFRNTGSSIPRRHILRF